LLLAWDTVVISVHFNMGAILEEKRCFFTGRHLGAVGSAVAFVQTPFLNVDMHRRRPDLLREIWNSLSEHFRRVAWLVLFVSFLCREYKQHDYDKAFHLFSKTGAL